MARKRFSFTAEDARLIRSGLKKRAALHRPTPYQTGTLCHSWTPMGCLSNKQGVHYQDVPKLADSLLKGRRNTCQTK